MKKIYKKKPGGINVENEILVKNLVISEIEEFIIPVQTRMGCYGKGTFKGIKALKWSLE